MKSLIGRGRTVRAAAIGRAVVIAVGLALLSACGGYEKISAQPYDTDYEVFSVVGWSGNVDVFMIKTFESDGMVALCGGYTAGTSPIAKIASRQWADISQIYINDTKIGTGEFLGQMPVYGFKQGGDPKAMFLALQEEAPALPCVRSRVPWRAEYDSAKVNRRGPKRITVTY